VPVTVSPRGLTNSAVSPTDFPSQAVNASGGGPCCRLPVSCEDASFPNAITAMKITNRVIMDVFFTMFIEKSPEVGFKILSILLY
jgi:hypothetical protein